MKRKFILFFTSFLFLFYACVEEPCYDKINPRIRFYLYAINGSEVIDTTINSFQIIADTINLDTTFRNKGVASLPVPQGVEQLKLKVIARDLRYFDCDSFMEIKEVMIDSVLTYDTIFTVDRESCVLTTDTKRRDSTINNYYEHDIDLKYKHTPMLINYDCGLIMGIDSLEAVLNSANYIDSIRVKSKKVTNDPSENIQVYF